MMQVFRMHNDEFVISHSILRPICRSSTALPANPLETHQVLAQDKLKTMIHPHTLLSDSHELRD
jgi:hypothetical protein